MPSPRSLLGLALLLLLAQPGEAVKASPPPPPPVPPVSPALQFCPTALPGAPFSCLTGLGFSSSVAGVCARGRCGTSPTNLSFVAASAADCTAANLTLNFPVACPSSGAITAGNFVPSANYFNNISPTYCTNQGASSCVTGSGNATWTNTTVGTDMCWGYTYTCTEAGMSAGLCLQSTPVGLSVSHYGALNISSCSLWGANGTSYTLLSSVNATFVVGCTTPDCNTVQALEASPWSGLPCPACSASTPPPPPSTPSGLLPPPSIAAPPPPAAFSIPPPATLTPPPSPPPSPASATCPASSPAPIPCNSGLLLTVPTAGVCVGAQCNGNTTLSLSFVANSSASCTFAGYTAHFPTLCPASGSFTAGTYLGATAWATAILNPVCTATASSSCASYTASASFLNTTTVTDFCYGYSFVCNAARMASGDCAQDTPLGILVSQLGGLSFPACAASSAGGVAALTLQGVNASVAFACNTGNCNSLTALGNAPAWTGQTCAACAPPPPPASMVPPPPPPTSMVPMPPPMPFTSPTPGSGGSPMPAPGPMPAPMSGASPPPGSTAPAPMMAPGSPPPPPPPPVLPTMSSPPSWATDLQNIAYLARSSVSSVSSAAASATLPLSFNSSGQLSTPASYASACSGASQFGTASWDTQPYFQVDLGRTAIITGIQLWPSVGFEDWLSPISVYVSNNPSLSGGVQPCFNYNSGAAVSSVQGGCSGTGRYITLWLTGNNTATVTAQPQQRMLRLCSLMAFGAFLQPPPPPPPPRPLPPPAPAPPPQPFAYLSDPGKSGFSPYLLIVLIVPTGIVLGGCLFWFFVLRPRRRDEEKAAWLKVQVQDLIVAAHTRDRVVHTGLPR